MKIKKKISILLSVIIIAGLFAGCKSDPKSEMTDLIGTEEIFAEESAFAEETAETVETVTDVKVVNPVAAVEDVIMEAIPAGEPITKRNFYDVRELSRDGDYKLIEMYVDNDHYSYSRRITFEIPAEWPLDDDSTFENDEDWVYTLKVDMWRVVSVERDDMLNLNKYYTEECEFPDEYDYYRLIGNDIYSTENYEIFYYKFETVESQFDSIYHYEYYLYANGEYFFLSGYVFHEYKPEFDDIVKRIAESVIFY